MGMDVKVQVDNAAADMLGANLARALMRGGEVLAELSNAGAPTEPDLKHGVHMAETVFVRPSVGDEGDPQVVVGYGAFWAVWQHERTDWDHPHGGHAKFLELALVEGQEAIMAAIAEGARL